MKEALEAVWGGLALKAAARRFHIPYTTLQNRFAEAMGRKQRKRENAGAMQVFTADQEKTLKERIIRLAKFGCGLTRKDIIKAAYAFAEANNITNIFSAAKQMAGKDWLQAFLTRHPDLTVRKPQDLSEARCAGLNKEIIDRYFALLKELLNFPQLIYSCGETGIPLNNPTRPIVTLSR